MAKSQPLEWTDHLRAYSSLFDLMEEIQNEHPEITDDDEIYELAIKRGIDQHAAAYDRYKERRRGE